MTAFVSFERVFEVLDAPSPIQDRPGAVDLVDPTGRIELDGVRFAYPTTSIVASLEAPAPTGDGTGPARPALLLDGVTATPHPGPPSTPLGPSGPGKTPLALPL